jgi:hypothetical protein
MPQEGGWDTGIAGLAPSSQIIESLLRNLRQEKSAGKIYSRVLVSLFKFNMNLPFASFKKLHKI